MGKPNCYNCKWRRNLAGDTHNFCVHPDLDIDTNNPMFELAGLLTKRLKITCDQESLQKGIDKLGIRANYHGIKQGWFNFPFNFDPVWLEECDGFTKKEEK